ncbi:VOC family protein [Actinomadura bangladeshensis]|uniref:VOC family protein n=1 Tax=Actinomadura bangladeshensis TaxID=453573 RepID=A0A6L9QDA1_9ACTN|nr:VOC family protein [Actinomadura bangladeshensis]NEA23477.1 VOC family protein [Actinomadura bangladeshensis]
MLRGIATISLWADDLEAAKDWYAELLGVAPYFSVPGPDGRAGYYEFRIGDYEHELGLIDARFRPGGGPEGGPAGPGGAIVYWHVDDLDAAVERLLAMGARVHEKTTERGEGTGFVTASVVDPFGNVLGVMSNPHYLEILARARPAGV